MRFKVSSYLAPLILLLAAGALSFAQQTSITRSSNLRQKPTTQSPVLETLAKGDTVTLTSTLTRAGYYAVKTADGKAGWVWAKNVARVKVAGAVRVPSHPKEPAALSLSCANPAFPGEATVMDSSTCGATGNGGAEAAQNEAKNNFCATTDPKPFAIADLVQLQQKVETQHSVPFGNPRIHPLSDAPGPATDRSVLEGFGEGTSVVLTGYVKIARQEGSESVNCGTNVPNQADYHDIHISIVDQPDAEECSGIVAEMIPHHRPSSWTPKLVNKVRDAKLQVRLTGSLMFDSSHTPCQDGSPIKGDPSRASLWEVHPIYKFEVCNQADCSGGTGWVALEDWKSE